MIFLVITMAMQLYFSDMLGINDMQWGCGAGFFFVFLKNRTENFSNVKKKITFVLFLFEQGHAEGQSTLPYLKI